MNGDRGHFLRLLVTGGVLVSPVERLAVELGLVPPPRLSPGERLGRLERSDRFDEGRELRRRLPPAVERRERWVEPPRSYGRGWREGAFDDGAAGRRLADEGWERPHGPAPLSLQRLLASRPRGV